MIEKFNRKSKGSSAARRFGFVRKMLAALLLVVPFIIAAAWLLLGGVIKTQAAPGINKSINYQGRIANVDGVSLAGGNYDFKFELYNAVSGGSPLWSETWSTTTSAGAVRVINGAFSVPLGSSSSMSGIDFSDDSLYLQVYMDANGDGTFEEAFTPRKRLTASPYAFNSDMVDGLHATTTATANQLLALDARAGLSVNGVTTTDSFFANGIATFGNVATFNNIARFNNEFFGTTARLAALNATTTNVGNLLVYNNATINGNVDVGGYASTTLGLFTQGTGHIGGTLTVDGTSLFNSEIIGTNGARINVINATSTNIGTLTVYNTASFLDEITAPSARISVVNATTTNAGSLTVYNTSYFGGKATFADEIFGTTARLSVFNASTTNADTFNVYTLATINNLIGSEARLSMLNASTTNVGNLHVYGSLIYDGELTVNNSRIPMLNATTTNIDNLTVYNTSVFRGEVLGDVARFAMLNASTTNIDMLHVYNTSNFDGLLTAGDARVAVLNASSTNIGNLTLYNDATINGLATSTLGFFTQGNSHVGGNMSVDGNFTLGGTLTAGGLVMNGNFAPSVASTYNLGAADKPWANGYIDSLHVTTLYADVTEVTGTMSPTFTINSDNVTADAEDSSIVFEKGSATNASIGWSSTNKQFTFTSGENDTALSLIPGTGNAIFRTAPGKSLTIFGGDDGADAGETLTLTSYNWNIGLDGSIVTSSYASTTLGLFTRGNGHFGGALSVDGRITFGSDSYITRNTVDGSDSGYLGMYAGGDYGRTRGGGMTFYGNEFSGAGYQGRVTIEAGNVYTSGNDGAIVFRTGNGLERMIVSYNGSVGVATTTPGGYYDEKLTVVGGENIMRSTGGNEMLFNVGTSTTNNILSVKSSGNVGIGTSAPLSALHIGNSDNSLNILTFGGTTNNSLGDGASLGTINWFNSDTSSTGNQVEASIKAVTGMTGYGRGAELVFSTGDSYDPYVNLERMRISMTGSIGIATSTPGGYYGEKLTVVGGENIMRATGGQEMLFNVGTTTANNLFIVKSNGNVGIGTSAPSRILDIAFNGASATNGIRLSYTPNPAGYYAEWVTQYTAGLPGFNYNFNIKDSDAGATYNGALMTLTGRNGGAIGIATTTPGGYYGEKLTVNGNTLLFGAATTTHSLYIGAYASSTAGLFTQGDGHFGSTLTVDGKATTTGNTSLQGTLFVKDGTVGIGTATIANTLDVAGNLGIKGAGAFRLYNSDNSQYATIQMGTSGVSANYNWFFSGFASTTQGLLTQGNGHFGGTLSVDGLMSASDARLTMLNSTTTNIGTLRVYTGSTFNGLSTFTDLRPTMLNASTTNIGTLGVYGNTTHTGSTTFNGEVFGNSAVRLSVLNASTTNLGNTHIYGTLTYDGTLDVSTINATVTNAGTLYTSGNSTVLGYASSTSLYVGIDNQTATSTWIRGGLLVDGSRAGGNPTLVVNANENYVGVGMLNPKTPLDVVGTIRTDDIVSTMFGLYNNVNYNNGYKYRETGTSFGVNMQSSINYMSLQYSAAGTAGGAITFYDGIALKNDGSVGIGVTAPSYKLSVGSANNTKQIGIYHDNTNAYFTTTGGSFIFQTDEGTNTNTGVQIRGKGTGIGVFQIYDEDKSEWLQVYASNGTSVWDMAGVAPGGMNFQHSGNGAITMFDASPSGTTRELNVYGYRTGDALRSLQVGVGVDAADTASFDGVSNYYFDGNIGIGTSAPASGLQIGAADANIVYNSATRARIFGTTVQSQTDETLLRLIRNVSTNVYYAGVVDFNVGAYQAGGVGVNYNPATRLTISLKSNTNHNEDANVDVMSLQSNGYVGINDTTPIAMLNIQGGSANWTEATPGTAVGSIHLDPGSATDHFGNAITFGASDTGNGETAQAGIYVRSDSSYGSKMYFGTTNAYATGAITRMMIDYDGEIGIGTTAPSDKLHIVTATDNAGLKIEKSDSGDSNFEGPAMTFVNQYYGTPATLAQIQGYMGLGYSGNLIFKVKPEDNSSATSPAEVVRFNDAEARFKRSASLERGASFGSVDNKIDANGSDLHVYAKNDMFLNAGRNLVVRTGDSSTTFADGSFESSIGTWTNSEGTPTLGQSNEFTYSGFYSMKWADTDGAANNTESYRAFGNVAAMAGKTVTISVRYKVTANSNTNGVGANLLLLFAYDGTGGTGLGSGQGRQLAALAGPTTADWTYGTWTGTIPANVSNVRLYIRKATWYETGSVMYIDDVHLFINSDASTGGVGIATTDIKSNLTVNAPYASTNNAPEAILGSAINPIGDTVGSYKYVGELQARGSASNTHRLEFAAYRRIAGNGWTGAGWRIQDAVDTSFTDGSKAYIEVGSGDPNTVGGGYLSFGTAGADRMVINNAGNVGIATTSPSAAFNIDKAVTADQINSYSELNSATISTDLVGSYNHIKQTANYSSAISDGSEVNGNIIDIDLDGTISVFGANYGADENNRGQYIDYNTSRTVGHGRTVNNYGLDVNMVSSGNVGITSYSGSKRLYGANIAIADTSNVYQSSNLSAYGLNLDMDFTGVAQSAIASSDMRGLNVDLNAAWSGTFGSETAYGARIVAANAPTTYGVYASAAGGTTNYGIYSAAGLNYFNGNVGIGVSPSYKLHVYDTGTLMQGDFEVNNASGRSILATIMSSGAGGATLEMRTHGSSYSETLLGNSMTDAVALLSQSASLMAIGTTGATDVAFATNNTERMRIKSSGDVDIASGAVYHNNTTGVTQITNLEVGAMNFDTNAGVISWADMPVTSSATAGTVESYTAQIDGTAILTVYAQSNGSGGIQYPRVGIGTTAPTGTLTAPGVYSDTVGATYRALYVDNTGKIGYLSSASKYKNNIVDMADSSWLYNLRPVNFNYKFDASTTTQYGLIAEEVEKVNKDFVFYNNEGGLEGVYYDKLIPVLVSELKNLKVKIDAVSQSPASSSSAPLTVSDNPQSTFATLSVTESATFYGTITVVGEAKFKHKVVFEKDVEIQGKLYVSEDQAGSITLLTGATSTEVKFKEPYEVIPKILVTPQDRLGGSDYWISDKSTSTFRLNIDPFLDHDVIFDWIAMPAKGMIAGAQEPIVGCMDSTALNYDSTATENSGCQYSTAPDPDPVATTTDPVVTPDPDPAPTTTPGTTTEPEPEETVIIVETPTNPTPDSSATSGEETTTNP